MPSKTLRNLDADKALQDVRVNGDLVRSICLDLSLDPDSEDYLTGLKAYHDARERWRGQPTVGQVLDQIPKLKKDATRKLLAANETARRPLAPNLHPQAFQLDQDVKRHMAENGMEPEQYVEALHAVEKKGA